MANFVETEQVRSDFVFDIVQLYLNYKIIKIIDVYDGHTLSFVIIRGSIPIYWSQSGMKYRPPPRIDRSK